MRKWLRDEDSPEIRQSYLQRHSVLLCTRSRHLRPEDLISDATQRHDVPGSRPITPASLLSVSPLELDTRREVPRNNSVVARGQAAASCGNVAQDAERLTSSRTCRASAAELSTATFWSFVRELSSCAGSGSCQRSTVLALVLSGAGARWMIGPMTTTSRPQQRYDHRLCELVRGTGDVTIATGLGVPRSTAPGGCARRRRPWSAST